MFGHFWYKHCCTFTIKKISKKEDEALTYIAIWPADVYLDTKHNQNYIVYRTVNTLGFVHWKFHKICFITKPENENHHWAVWQKVKLSPLCIPHCRLTQQRLLVNHNPFRFLWSLKQQNELRLGRGFRKTARNENKTKHSEEVTNEFSLSKKHLSLDGKLRWCKGLASAFLITVLQYVWVNKADEIRKKKTLHFQVGIAFKNVTFQISMKAW